MERNRITLDRPSKINAVTDKQLLYLHSLFVKKNIAFPFDSDQEAKRKLSKSDASKIIDVLRNGEKIKLHYI